MTLRVVYLAAPYSGEDWEFNLARACRWLEWALQQPGIAPLAPWVHLGDLLPEMDYDEAMARCYAWIARADELWAVGGRWSPGMWQEAEHARSLGIGVRDLTAIGPEPPEGQA